MELPSILNAESLDSYLKSHNIDTSLWGSGEAKTLNHLLHEIQTGDSVLIEDQNERLLRIVRGVGINIFYQSKEGILKLKEDRQVFSDGRVRRRNLTTSIGEKMKPNELPKKGAARALKEELQIYSSYNFSNFETRNWEVESTSFPGLYTQNEFFVFDEFLNESDFKREGYIEVQEDKTSYYVWTAHRESSNSSKF